MITDLWMHLLSKKLLINDINLRWEETTAAAQSFGALRIYYRFNFGKC